MHFIIFGLALNHWFFVSLGNALLDAWHIELSLIVMTHVPEHVLTEQPPGGGHSPHPLPSGVSQQQQAITLAMASDIITSRNTIEIDSGILWTDSPEISCPKSQYSSDFFGLRPTAQKSPRLGPPD